MSAMRPAFGAAWNRFREVNVNVEQVGKLLGGKVQHNIDAGIFKNACPIRMSYVCISSYCSGAGRYVSRLSYTSTIFRQARHYYLYRPWVE